MQNEYNINDLIANLSIHIWLLLDQIDKFHHYFANILILIYLINTLRFLLEANAKDE